MNSRRDIYAEPLTRRSHQNITNEPHFVGKMLALDTLPTAAVGYRGVVFLVEGAAGVADVLYCCMKGAADTYSWVQIVTA